MRTCEGSPNRLRCKWRWAVRRAVGGRARAVDSGKTVPQDACCRPLVALPGSVLTSEQEPASSVPARRWHRRTRVLDRAGAWPGAAHPAVSPGGTAGVSGRGAPPEGACRRRAWGWPPGTRPRAAACRWLCRQHENALDLDELVEAVHDEPLPVRVDAGDVSGVQPAVFVDGLGVGFGVVEVALHDLKPGDSLLPGKVGRHECDRGAGPLPWPSVRLRAGAPGPEVGPGFVCVGWARR